QLAGALPVHGQRQGVGRAGGQLVEERDRLVDRGQLVEPVDPRRTDPEVKVDLRGHPHFYRPHGSHAGPVAVLPERLGHRTTADWSPAAHAMGAVMATTLPGDTDSAARR